MSQLTTTEARAIDIERSQGGSITPTNNGIIINWGSSGGGGAAPVESTSSSLLGPLMGIGIVAMAGLLLFQLISEGVNSWKTSQLQQQNQLLTQQLTAQQAQIEGVKSLVCSTNK